MMILLALCTIRLRLFIILYKCKVIRSMLGEPHDRYQVSETEARQADNLRRRDSERGVRTGGCRRDAAFHAGFRARPASREGKRSLLARTRPRSLPGGRQTVDSQSVRRHEFRGRK